MHLRAVPNGLLLAAAVVLAPLAAAPALACTGPLPPAIESLTTASAVALVRVDGFHGPDHQRTYELAVEEVFKGSLPPALRIEAPEYHGCGGRIIADQGARLLIAFDARPFSASINRYAPYWTVAADGRLGPEGIDDTRLGWTTVDEFRAGMAGRFGSAEPPTEPKPAGAEPAAAGWTLLLVALGVIGGAGLLFAAVWLVARHGSRDGRGARP